MRARGQLGEGAVLSVSAAAAELGLREADAVAWLRAQGLVAVVRLPGGRGVERVSWRRVLAAIESGVEPDAPAPTPVPSRLRRATSL